MLPDHEAHENDWRSPLQRLFVHRFKFRIRLSQAARLHWYKGAVIHGLIGNALQIAQQELNMHQLHCCLAHGETPRALLYRPTVSEAVFRKVSTSPYRAPDAPGKPAIVPTGYVLTPDPSVKTSFEAGDELSWRLTLVGHLHHYLPLWIRAFEIGGWQLGLGKDRARYALVDVVDEASEQCIYEGTNRHLVPCHQPIRFDEFSLPPGTSVERMVLDFETLLSIKAEKSRDMITGLSSSNVVRFLYTLYRRCFVLSQLYCQWPYAPGAVTETEDIVPIPKMAFEHEAQMVRVLDTDTEKELMNRYVKRLKGKVTHEGIIGPVLLAGNLTPFWEMLQMGTLLGMGKKASEGYGRYNIPPEFLA